MLITYDISPEDVEGQARLRRIAKHCLDYGVRVQHSVFENDVTPAQWVKLKAKLPDTYQPETDSLRFYRLAANSGESRTSRREGGGGCVSGYVGRLCAAAKRQHRNKVQKPENSLLQANVVLKVVGYR